MAKSDLIPVKDPEEARKRGRNGGVASGKARREKKMMRETLEMLLSMPLNNKKMVDVDSIRSFGALKGKNVSVQEAMMMAQVMKAIKGDTKAAEYVRDTIGQKPVENVELRGEITNDPFSGLTTEELKKMIADG